MTRNKYVVVIKTLSLNNISSDLRTPFGFLPVFANTINLSWTLHIPSEILNVYDFDIKVYTSKPITAHFFFQEKLWAEHFHAKIEHVQELWRYRQKLQILVSNVSYLSIQPYKSSHFPLNAVQSLAFIRRINWQNPEYVALTPFRVKVFLFQIMFCWMFLCILFKNFCILCLFTAL